MKETPKAQPWFSHPEIKIEKAVDAGAIAPPFG
jgi:hypothetical protein